MPKRIQMSRQHPWRADNPDAVIVARPGRYGNPFSAGVLGREHAVAAFRQLLSADGADARPHLDYPEPEAIVAELADRDLACWCPLDQPCHADVLLEIANCSTDAEPGDDDYDESLDACPACDSLPSECFGGCCADCNHASSWHAGMASGPTVSGPWRP